MFWRVETRGKRTRCIAKKIKISPGPSRLPPGSTKHQHLPPTFYRLTSNLDLPSVKLLSNGCGRGCVQCFLHVFSSTRSLGDANSDRHGRLPIRSLCRLDKAQHASAIETSQLRAKAKATGASVVLVGRRDQCLGNAAGWHGPTVRYAARTQRGPT